MEVRNGELFVDNREVEIIDSWEQSNSKILHAFVSLENWAMYNNREKAIRSFFNHMKVIITSCCIFYGITYTWNPNDIRFSYWLFFVEICSETFSDYITITIRKLSVGSIFYQLKSSKGDLCRYFCHMVFLFIYLMELQVFSIVIVCYTLINCDSSAITIIWMVILILKDFIFICWKLIFNIRIFMCCVKYRFKKAARNVEMATQGQNNV